MARGGGKKKKRIQHKTHFGPIQFVLDTTQTFTTIKKMSDNKAYIVTLKDDTSDQEVESIKSKIKDLGGEITNEFSLIKGFAVKLPQIHADSLHKVNQIATVEEDKEVHTQ